MLYAIISDIQGNYTNLERAIQNAHADGATQFLCLGDIVHDGTDYAEERCVQHIHTINGPTVRGNHELDVLTNGTGRLSAESIDYLNQLPAEIRLGDILLYHDSIRQSTTRDFTLTDAAAEFETVAAKYPHVTIVFRGHTHQAQAFLRKGYHTQHVRFRKQTIPCTEKGIYLLSPGSIGMPSEDLPASYGLFDTESRLFRIRPIDLSALPSAPSPSRTVSSP